jgi:hypothetical protein
MSRMGPIRGCNHQPGTTAASHQPVTANRKLLTANCKPLTVALESIMERNLVEAIDPDTEIIDQAIF